MKKGFGILFMLTLVVLIASVGVYVVQDFTAPYIQANKDKAIQESVEEVFPEISGTTWLPSPAPDTMKFTAPITGATLIKDGDTLKGIVYQVTFQGFANTFDFVIGVNADGEVTGYKTLKNNETASSAGEFDDPETFAAIISAQLSSASGAFDGVSGATYTTDFLKTALDAVAVWHNDAGVFGTLTQLEKDAAIIKAKLNDETLVVTDLPTADLEKLSEASIDFAYEAEGDSGSYVIYIEEYNSYEPATKVFLAVNKTTHETVKFEVLANKDTADWGGKLLSETDRWTQLEDQSLNFLVNGEFDDLGGATTTYSTWQDAMYRIAAFHQEAYQGIITYSLDELIPEYESQLSPVTLGGMSTWTIFGEEGTNLKTGNDGAGFKVTYDDPGTNSQSIKVSQDGFDFVAGTDYRITFVAYADNEKGIKVTLGDFLSKKVTLDKHDENPEENTYRINFTPTENVTDVTLTLGLGKAISTEKDGIVTIVEVRVEEMGGYSPDQATNQVVNSTLETTDVVEVTEQKFSNTNISNIFDIVNDLGEVEGTIYYGYTFGAYDNGPTLINFMLGIDAAGNYTGFRFLGTTDSNLNPSSIYTADYAKFLTPGYFAEEIEGEAITSSIAIADVDGLELQISSIEAAINEIGRYHNEDYSKRDNESIDEAELVKAIDGAVSFVEIYNDYDFVQGVVNVYEAYDASNDLIGYVYASKYFGMSSSTEILYTIGVDLDGNTENINIYQDKESWAVSGYGGSEGPDFATSTWLANFEDLDASNFVLGYTPDTSNPTVGESDLIDSVAGVSTTTGGDSTHFGLIDSVYVVLKFHEDNSVGGAS